MQIFIELDEDEKDINVTFSNLKDVIRKRTEEANATIMKLAQMKKEAEEQNMEYLKTIQVLAQNQKNLKEQVRTFFCLFPGINLVLDELTRKQGQISKTPGATNKRPSQRKPLFDCRHQSCRGQMSTSTTRKGHDGGRVCEGIGTQQTTQ